MSFFVGCSDSFVVTIFWLGLVCVKFFGRGWWRFVWGVPARESVSLVIPAGYEPVNSMPSGEYLVALEGLSGRLGVWSDVEVEVTKIFS